MIDSKLVFELYNLKKFTNIVIRYPNSFCLSFFYFFFLSCNSLCTHVLPKISHCRHAKICQFFWGPINKVWFDESVPLASVSHNSKELFLSRKTGIYFTFSLSKINVTYCHWQCPPFLSWLFKNPLSIPMMHSKHVATCLWLTEFSTCRLHRNIWITFCLQNHFFQIFNSYSSNCISLAFVFFNFSLWVHEHVFLKEAWYDVIVYIED